MTSLKICMLAIVGLCAAMIVKQWKSDFLPLIRLSATLLLTQAILVLAHAVEQRDAHRNGTDVEIFLSDHPYRFQNIGYVQHFFLPQT